MKQEDNFEVAKEKLVNYLATKNLRKTPERFAILAQIYQLESHFDVETLYEMMTLSGYRVSRATVYNTVDLLVECHLIRKHQFGTAMAHYGKTTDVTDHFHIICTSCNHLEEVHDESLHAFIKEKQFENYRIDNFNLYMYGLCQNCLKEQSVEATR